MTVPTVSIIMPTYNRLTYLKEAVDSARAQTFANWELIVIDDGSTDGSVAWLQSLRDSRIIVLPVAHCGNRSQLRNIGLRKARGQWFAFLDDDDRWMRTKLERQLAYHDAHPGILWSYTAATKIDADGRPLSPELFKPWVPHSGRILEQVLSLDANIAMPTVIVDMALLRDIGGLSETCYTEDFELWVRLAERVEIGLVDEPLLEIRKHRAVNYQWPEISLGFTTIYQDFAARTTDARLREQSLTRAAYHAVDAANRLGVLGRWSEARAAVTLARRIRPRAPFVYKAMARLAWRQALAAISFG